jgi:MerR family copper efflux transcriptional regulator
MQEGVGLMTKKLLKAGELAKKSGLLVTTIRYYTKIGLLKADGTTPGQYNLYNEESALARLKKIEGLKKQRYTLDEIKKEMAV